MIRLVAVQRWPVVPKPPQRPPSIARSRLASSRTIMGFLPPSSSEQAEQASEQAESQWKAAEVAERHAVQAVELARAERERVAVEQQGLGAAEDMLSRE